MTDDTQAFDYQIVSERTPQALMDRLQQWFDDGYRPIGGVAVSFHVRDPESHVPNSGFFMYQAVTRGE